MAGSSRSNDNGRSLEYVITDSLSQVKGCRLTARAKQDQVRDARTVTRIDPRLRKSFISAAEVTCHWILKELGVGANSAFEVDRRSDSDEGVADLKISHGRHVLFLSVKHNYDALSHPRPYSLADSMDLADAMGLLGLGIELDHRRRMDDVTTRFRQAARGTSIFSSVPKAKLDLYRAVCRECARTVNDAGSSRDAVQALFSFLVGSEFRKLIVKTDQSTKGLKSIAVVDYTSIAKPNSVVASVENRAKASSLILTFDNGWVLDLRIKNASKEISASGQLSLKFDAQRKSDSLPPKQVLL